MRLKTHFSDRTYRNIGWMLIATLALLIGSCEESRADVVTEFGIGYKFDSSFVLMPECSEVHNHHWDYDNEREVGTFRSVPCGGNNPAFIGWPIAWEKDNLGRYGAWRVRSGWFHYSNVFDGSGIPALQDINDGDAYETTLNLAAASATWNWTKFFKGRRARRGK